MVGISVKNRRKVLTTHAYTNNVRTIDFVNFQISLTESVRRGRSREPKHVTKRKTNGPIESFDFVIQRS